MTDEIAAELTNAGCEVLLDDRNERPGVMFAEMDLLGIPLRLVIGERGLKNDTVELRDRRSGETEEVAISEVAGRILVRG